ncbi:lysozyme [Oxobacter pfennigii]|uniref:Lysozyme n=1 Tax=Oxobacter pfennigii TaxID=36849 RepID=A0A0N8NSI8_9CLOT|nr:GPW/gp25 family protein [Oxobacter pfennigii]KPU42152.1 lysozyme [Oxobacter pfennigii]
MVYTIDTTKAELNWAARGAERILQNVQNLISTFKYEVAYKRTMGIDPDIIDLPIEKLKARYAEAVYQLILDYEPRATVKNVRFIDIDKEGHVNFAVEVEI